MCLGIAKGCSNYIITRFAVPEANQIRFRELTAHTWASNPSADWKITFLFLQKSSLDSKVCRIQALPAGIAHELSSCKTIQESQTASQNFQNHPKRSTTFQNIPKPNETVATCKVNLITSEQAAAKHPTAMLHAGHSTLKRSEEDKKRVKNLEYSAIATRSLRILSGHLSAINWKKRPSSLTKQGLLISMRWQEWTMPTPQIQPALVIQTHDVPIYMFTANHWKRCEAQESCCESPR